MPATETPAGANPAGLAALILGSTLLAFGPLLVRLSDAGPVATAFWRMALAAPVLIAVALIQNRRQPVPTRPRHLPIGLALAAGTLFACDIAVWHLGIVRTTTANATLFANTTAFMLAGWAILVRREHPGTAVMQSLALAGAGALLLFGSSARVSSANLLGDLLSLSAAAFYTGYLLVIMALRGRFSTATVLAMSTLASALVLLPAALLEPAAFRPTDWRPLVALAISSQLAGQGLMVFASGRLPAPVLALGLLIQPLVSAAAGWLAFGETLGPTELVGAALILAALIRTSRRTAAP